MYCDEADLESIPPLPKATAYLYARFNRIRQIRAGDFEGLSMQCPWQKNPQPLCLTPAPRHMNSHRHSVPPELVSPC